MPDKSFLDSNVVLYLLDKNSSHKKDIALQLIQQECYISPQVIFECLNVCLRKLRLDNQTTLQFVRYLQQTCLFQEEHKTIIDLALHIFERYQLQPFDSKIVATAIAADCSVFYSEDMHHGLMIENKLTVVNPFL